MSEISTPVHQLPAGTLLSDKYEIIRTLGEGGFGITYIGRNMVLDIPVAIKEYYPHGYANRNTTYDLSVTITDSTKNSYFAKWKDKFLNEARTLAKFSNIPNIVNVLDFFEQNSTAYIVMEYLNGLTLSDYVSKNGVFNADRLCRIMIPMLRSLNKIHQKKLIHRDISPDNIMVMPDGSLKLFDFGAARDYSETTQRSLSVMLKPGFAPEEQYRSRGFQGPWTDVYSACATMYFCITGKKPDDSIQRVFSDELKSPSELGICISPQIEAAILMGMSVKSEDRFNTAEALANAFEGALSVSRQTAPPNSVCIPLRQHPKAATVNIKVIIIGVIAGLCFCGIISATWLLSLYILGTSENNSSFAQDEDSAFNPITNNDSKTNSTDADSDLTSSVEDMTAIGLHGAWSGTTYTSDFLGVKCVLDSEWDITTDAELAAYFGGSDMSEESIKAVLDSGNFIFEMYVTNAKRNNININITIEDTRITKSLTFMSQRMCNSP